ncbi:MAG: hypothetical protein RRY10_06650, partial [Christensenellaceae bacterium]
MKNKSFRAVSCLIIVIIVMIGIPMGAYAMPSEQPQASSSSEPSSSAQPSTEPSTQPSASVKPSAEPSASVKPSAEPSEQP